MPIYEYRCTRCGDQSEVLQKITDRPLRKCEKCSGKLEKLISRTSFHLKGGGWFDSGYGGGNPGKSKEKKDSPSSSESTKSDKKETKNAAAAG